MFLAYSGDSAGTWLLRDQKDAWSSDKILTVGAGSLLFIYAIKLTYEYCTETDEGEEGKSEAGSELKDYAEVEQAEPAEAPEASGFWCCAKRPPPEKVEEEEIRVSNDEEKGVEPFSISDSKEDGESKEHAPKDRDPTQLFVIAFIGSVDDLTVFVPMLVGKAFDLVQLMLGAFIAASAIVMICLFVGLCKPIADCLSAVPLALIVAIFSAVLLTKGFMMD